MINSSKVLMDRITTLRLKTFQAYSSANMLCWITAHQNDELNGIRDSLSGALNVLMGLSVEGDGIVVASVGSHVRGKTS